jgi:hypothetical protein
MGRRRVQSGIVEGDGARVGTRLRRSWPILRGGHLDERQCESHGDAAWAGLVMDQEVGAARMSLRRRAAVLSWASAGGFVRYERDIADDLEVLAHGVRGGVLVLTFDRVEDLVVVGQ